MLLVLIGGAAPAAARGRVPVYRDPPSFLGHARLPAMQPPALPAPVALSRTGVFPDALVDEAGTAHIVWNEGRGNDADAAVYCRLKRGASRCDTSAVLTWDKAYGVGDGPQFNTDDGGPRIVRIGNQLVILSKRYPTVGDKPDGPSSSTVVAWASGDGGTIWTKAAIVGKGNLGQLVVFGPPADPTILNLGQDPLCGGTSGMCVEAYKSGEYTSGAGDLSTGPNQAYNPTLTVDRGTPVAGFADLTNHIFLRRWTGSGAVMDPATWSAPLTLAGEQPALAGGPAGLRLMSKPGYGRAFEIRPITTAGGTFTPGRAVRVSSAEDVLFPRLVQDPAGRVIAAWQQRGGTAPGVRMRISSPVSGAARDTRNVPQANAAAAPFAPEQLLVRGAGNGQLALSATSDGGGFAVLNHTGGVNSPGEIVASGFGASAPTLKPGLGGLPGTGTAGGSCAKVSFGSFDIEAAAGCFFHGEGVNAGLVTTGGEIDLFGLKIVPDGGAKLLIDPRKLTIESFGEVKVLVRSSFTGEIVLWHGVIKFDLSKAVPGTKLFDFPTGEYSVNILGFKPADNIQVFLQPDGVHIKLQLKLPKQFGGFTGKAEFVADRATGLHVNSVRVSISNVTLGVLTINDLNLTYTRTNDIWRGEGKLTIAKFGSIAASAEFRMGAFNGASIDFHPPVPVVIGPFVYLLGVNGAFRLDPTLISLGGQFGAGVAVKGEAPIKLDGKVTLSFPDAGPAEFRLDGKVSVAAFKLSEGFARYQTDGYADFNVTTDQDLAILRLKAKLEGFVDSTTGQWGADFHGEACFNYVLGCLSGSLDAAASAKGLAICGEPSVAGFGVSVGVQFGWSELNDLASSLAAAQVIPFYGYARAAYIVATNLKTPCHTDAFRVPPPRAASAAAGGQTVKIRAGLPTETLLVAGTHAVPSVDVIGPSGTLPGPAPGALSASSAAGSSLRLTAANAVMFVLKNPKAGSWTVRPRPGSPAVAEVRQSDGYRGATARAIVTGSARRRGIRYSISDLGHRQRVAFLERGRFGTRLLGTTTRSSGSFTIPPSGQPGGRRAIYAQVERDGLVTDRRVLTTYLALGPLGPGTVSHITVRRQGTTLSASWRAAPGAAHYIVSLRGVDGTSVATLINARSHSIQFPAIRRDERVTVEIRALSVSLQRGSPQDAVSPGARR